MKPEICEGRVVFSKKGRDKGYPFVVLLWLDSNFALICDGKIRKVDHPKRKRLKHLSATPHMAEELITLYKTGRLKDSDVRKTLRPFQADKAASAGPVSRSSHVEGEPEPGTVCSVH